jgi:hypothetical protein
MHYSYHQTLVAIWEKAVTQYGAGKREADTFFIEAEETFLASIGANAQEVYDFAEDFSRHGEPAFATFILLQDLRRAYFLEVQGGVPSGKVTESDTMPPKEASRDGIVWLPRIIPKALAKLRGEMNPDLMYGCGGDRKFFRNNDIHPAELLRIVWENEDDEEAIVKWVVARAERPNQPSSGNAVTSSISGYGTTHTAIPHPTR